MAVGSDAIKSAGDIAGAAAIVFTLGEVAITGQINASNLLNVGVTALSFIPVVGWMIGLGYFAADMITLGITGESIGQHLDDAVGHPLKELY